MVAQKSLKNPQSIHGFDIVFGKIANDDVGETVQAVLDGTPDILIIFFI